MIGFGEVATLDVRASDESVPAGVVASVFEELPGGKVIVAQQDQYRPGK